MIFRQFVRSESGCASYLIGCVRSGEAIVVDPLADLGARAYALEAADRGLRIAYVIDTHIHADHRSAAQELAHATGATLALPAEAPVKYAFHPLRDGDTLTIGAVRLDVLHTPGHTPESICLLGIDTARSEEPWFLLSGDTLFPGDVGRPDLLLDDAETRSQTAGQARQLHHSLFERLLKLDDIVEVYPGHFGGSACGGVHLSGKPMTTIGFERRWNLALQRTDCETFVDFVLDTLRPQPDNFRQIKRDNLRLRRPPIAALSSEARRAGLRPADVAALCEEGVVLVDVRPAADFAAAHAPGAVSVPFNRVELVTNLDKLLPLETAVVLVAENDIVAEEAGGLLREAGRRVAGVLAGGMAAWWAEGRAVATLERWTLDDLRARMNDNEIAIVDVREPHEWAEGVIQSAWRIPQGDVWARRDELPRDRRLVTICAGGVRSARVASLLAYLGFPHVATVDDAGMVEWIKRRYPTSAI
jgi:hydroxyacylglutathione hydrolase